MKVLICGSRNFTDYKLFKIKIQYFLKNQTNPTIISGAAIGADTLAIQYANEKKLPLLTIPADWKKHGRSAGFKRNYELVANADACIAFIINNSKGTEHTVRLAKEKGIPVREIHLQSELNAICTNCQHIETISKAPPDCPKCGTPKFSGLPF